MVWISVLDLNLPICNNLHGHEVNTFFKLKNKGKSEWHNVIRESTISIKKTTETYFSRSPREEKYWINLSYRNPLNRVEMKYFPFSRVYKPGLLLLRKNTLVRGREGGGGDGDFVWLSPLWMSSKLPFPSLAQCEELDGCTVCSHVVNTYCTTISDVAMRNRCAVACFGLCWIWPCTLWCSGISKLYVTEPTVQFLRDAPDRAHCAAVEDIEGEPDNAHCETTTFLTDPTVQLLCSWKSVFTW